MKCHFLAAALLLTAASAHADEFSITLKPGAGLDAVKGHCGSCHSLDYIVINSPFPSPKLWEAEVQKMIRVFGAPIDDAEAKEISEYLAKNYGS